MFCKSWANWKLSLYKLKILFRYFQPILLKPLLFSFYPQICLIEYWYTCRTHEASCVTSTSRKIGSNLQCKTTFYTFLPYWHVPQSFPRNLTLNPLQLFPWTRNYIPSEGIQLVCNHSAIGMPCNRLTYAAQQSS